ncbi:metal-dependent hydrolase [Thermodesulfovibrio sp. 3907-1M]|uniref:Metal-dependent hydrolase n=1 Tax=Thermodesulfovibrio autotrophicus TaxID=3118333 RepID=A0AAU8GXX1_9BACT
MKWINHKISTFAITMLLTGNFAGSVIAAAGSIIPDAVEGHDYESERWRKNHRRLSHWLAGYIGVAIFLWSYLKFKLKINALVFPVGKYISLFSVFNSETLIYLLFYGGFFLSIGCILHVLEDALSSTVPVLHPTKRVFTLGLMRTGSPAEYLLSFSLLAGMLFFLK